MTTRKSFLKSLVNFDSFKYKFFFDSYEEIILYLIILFIEIADKYEFF